MKNSLEGFISIFEPAEERLSKFENKSIEITASEEQGKKKKKNEKSEQNLRDLWNTIK